MLNLWKDNPLVWAVLAFIEVVVFTIIVPEICPEATDGELYNMWYVLLTATVTRIRSPHNNGDTEPEVPEQD